MADREMSDGVAEADSQLSKSTTGIKKSSRIPVPGGATISTPAQTPGLAFASTPHVSLLPRTPAPATAEDPTATPGSTTPSPGALSNGTSNNASSPSIGMPVPGGQAPDTPLPAAPTSGIPASGIPTFATPSSSRIPVVPSTPFLASSMSLRGPRTSTGGLLTRASSNGASSILGGSSTAIPSPPSPHPSITPPSAPPPPSSLFKRISAGASYTPGGTSTAIPSPPSSHSSIAPPSLTLPPYSPSPSSPTPSALGITIGSPGLASRTSGQTAWQLSPTSKPSPRLASNAFPSPPSSIGIPRPPPSIDYSAISQLDTHTIRGNQSVYNTTNAGADNKPTSAGIRVSVRLRPLSEKERVRGDKELWAIDEDANIGFYQGRDRKFVPKHRYNTVFGPTSSNYETHTMMGDVAAAFGDNGQPGIPAGGQPGITPLMVKQLFDSFAAESREFSVKLSMMEIYNEVLNDLLDPTRQNLKVYEDHTRGVVVESLSEEPVYSAEEALFLIQTGETNRKDSSRSHTICRLLIEGRDEPATANSAREDLPSGPNSVRPSCAGEQDPVRRSEALPSLKPPATNTLTTITPQTSHHAGSRDDLPSGPNSVRSSCAGEQDPVRRSGALPSFRPPAAAATGAVTTSVLSLIDLAGSESAKVSLSKGQRIEGSFINKSLLTLGTVINKLAQGQATHIPFRDSKLTRLLQNSLSGKGARIALICNITPATAQGEETANTLKFATRAKLVRISLSKNETIDEKGLLRRYAVEIQELRMQLILLQSSMTSPAIDSESDLEGLTSVSEAGGYSGTPAMDSESDLEGLTSVSEAGGYTPAMDSESDLEGLTSVSEAGGYSGTPAMDSESDLEGLTSVSEAGGYTPAMDSESDLEGLTSVSEAGGYTPAMDSESDLEGLTSVSEAGGFSGTPAMDSESDLEGLTSVSEAGGYTPAMDSESDLEGLTSVSEAGGFSGTPAMDSESDLEGLTSVSEAGGFTPAMDSESDLEGLTSVSEAGGFSGTPAMDSESDLEGLTSVSEAGGYSGSEVGAAIPGSELESLRRRLDAERQAHIRCKQEKALLEVRMIGLVHQLTDKRVTKRESTEDMNGYHAPWKDLRLEVDTLGGAGKGARVLKTSSSIFEAPKIPASFHLSTISHLYYISHLYLSSISLISHQVDTLGGAGKGARVLKTSSSIFEAPKIPASFHLSTISHLYLYLSSISLISHQVDTLGGAGKPARVSETSSSIFETPQPSPSSWLDMDQPARRDEGGAPISPHLFPVPETSELLTGNAPGGCVAAADSHASGGDEGNLPMGTQAGGDGLDNYGMHSNRGRHQGMSGPGSCIVEDTDLKDLEIQVLLAEREVLQDQIVSVELVNERLESEGMQWQMQAQEYSVEREKTLRILHELESDMSELRRLKNQSQAELNALRLETLTLGKADTGQGASLQRRIPSSSGASS
eukprot:gene22766-29934_t